MQTRIAKCGKKLLGLLLVVFTLMGAMTLTAWAAQGEDYELRIVTFEGDDWDALIDEPQYGGPLLYGEGGSGMADPYEWLDVETGLYHALLPSNSFGGEGNDYCYWSYGEAISNYVSGDIADTGDADHQLTVYKEGVSGVKRSGGGHNGSNNFVVHYGYADTAGYGLSEEYLPRLYLTNGGDKGSVIDHMYIKLTNYLLNCIVEGNGLTSAMGENDVLYVRAIGYDAKDNKISETRMNVCEGQNLIVQDWTKWDLSSLGEVFSVALEINGTSDNGYGFSQPAYFAFDDVAIRVPKTADEGNQGEEGEHTTHVDANSNDFCDVCGEYLGTRTTEKLPAKLIIPEGSEAKFYVGSDGTGDPVAAVDKGVDETNPLIHNYELEVPYGSYSCVVTDEEHNYGGVGFDFPLQTSIYEESNLTLVLVKFYTTTTSVKVNGVSTAVKIDSVDDFSIDLVAPGKAVIIPGENYLDSTITSGKTYVVAPRMVWAYGNQILYNYTIDLSDELSETLGAKPQINNTFASTLTAIQKKTFAISALNTFTVVAPMDADVTFFYQINNFNDMVLPHTVTDNGDGTGTYVVKYPSFSNASYRVAKDGYVTASGYAKDNTTYTVELRAGDPTSTETVIASKEGAGSNIEYENSVVLNIDDAKDTNELALEVGDTFRLRAYRAAWEIVNTVTANIMIEPDFHYSILSGNDVVSVTPVTTQCTGNATGNWMDIEALREGTAVIAVWYDAIDVAGNTTLNGTYGATDPNRYGLVVVNVGPDKTIEWNPVSFDGDWDAEFDTVYYFGESGTFTFNPDEAETVTVQNVYGRTAGEVITVEAEADGSYIVPVKGGNNIITVTTNDGADYMVVRAKKISYSIENTTTGKTNADDDFVISVGDEVIVHFDQFNMPVPKMSGIYNPGYMGTAKTYYTLNGQYSLSSVGTQYDYITDAKSQIKFTAMVEGENVLSKGYIQSGSMGDKFGNHRNTGDGGRGTNFSAVNVTGYFGSIEDITFTVGANPDAEFNYEDMVTLKKGNIFVGESTYNHAGTFSLTSKTTRNNAVYWTKTTETMAAQPDNFSLKANVLTNGYYVNLQM
ncbi:MAG: DUF4465 domain-containing protein, partial [Eubacteriales bacterium]|nr:DUF4465 domain-containing protein [Eubacteriales bacterium]